MTNEKQLQLEKEMSKLLKDFHIAVMNLRVIAAKSNEQAEIQAVTDHLENKIKIMNDITNTLISDT